MAGYSRLYKLGIALWQSNYRSKGRGTVEKASIAFLRLKNPSVRFWSVEESNDSNSNSTNQKKTLNDKNWIILSNKFESWIAKGVARNIDNMYN